MSWNMIPGAKSLDDNLYTVCGPSGAPIVGAVYFKNPQPPHAIGVSQTRYKTPAPRAPYKNDAEGWTSVHYVKRTKKSLIRD
jgi:hypothetical protein